MKDRKLGTTIAIAMGAITMAICATVASANDVTATQLKSMYGAELQVLGDVESIDLTHGSLLVAGQHISIAKETSFSYNGIPVDDQARALKHDPAWRPSCGLWPSRCTSALN